MVALSKKFHAPFGPLEVEAKAFESSLQFAKEVGLQEFHLNTGLLIAEIQANSAQNKANKMVNKIQPYRCKDRPNLFPNLKSSNVQNCENSI